MGHSLCCNLPPFASLCSPLLPLWSPCGLYWCPCGHPAPVHSHGVAPVCPPCHPHGAPVQPMASPRLPSASPWHPHGTPVGSHCVPMAPPKRLRTSIEISPCGSPWRVHCSRFPRMGPPATPRHHEGSPRRTEGLPGHPKWGQSRHQRRPQEPNGIPEGPEAFPGGASSNPLWNFNPPCGALHRRCRALSSPRGAPKSPLHRYMHKYIHAYGHTYHM